MAEVMARRGGLAVLPQDLSPERITSIVRSVKSRDLMVDHPLTLTVTGTLGQAAEYASTLDVLVSPSRLTDRIIGPTVGNACPTGACERRRSPRPESFQRQHGGLRR